MVSPAPEVAEMVAVLPLQIVVPVAEGTEGKAFMVTVTSVLGLSQPLTVCEA